MTYHPFIYITKSVIPSKFANTVQSANMACAFSKFFDGFSAAFRSPNPENTDLTGLFGSFALTPPLNLHLVPVRPNLDRAGAYLPAYAAFLQRHPRSSIVYTRNGAIAWTATLLGFQTVIELHDPLTPLYAKWLKKISSQDRRFRLVTTTYRLKADIVEQTNIPADHILVAGGGANAAFLDLPALTCPGNYGFNVGYAGSAFKGKGLEVMLACAERLPDVGFHVIGPSRDDCERLGYLGENVRLYGRKENREVIQMIKGMDCLMLANQRSVIIADGADIGQHTSPLKMFEYMAAGRAIIASDLPVLSGTLRHNRNALLAAPEDIDGFCSNINLLQKKPDLRNRLGTQACKDFSTSYTWDMRAQAIKSFIYG